MAEDFITVETASGMIDAEIIKGLLESRGIRVILRQESAASAIGLSVGPLAAVDILVPIAQEQAARDLLNDYHSGKLETED